MSGTVARIMVKVREDDLRQKKCFDGKKVRHYLNWGYLNYKNHNHKDETAPCRCEPVELDENYIGVSVNYDGYPSVTGKALKMDFNTYDLALNLCLGGEISAITNRVDEIKKYLDENDIKWAEDTKWFDGLKHYANRSIEHGGSIEWEHIRPTQGKTMHGLLKIVKYDTPQYCYVFDERKGGWVFYKVIKNKRGLSLLEIK